MRKSLAYALATMLLGCGADGGSELPSFEDFSDGKFDTGYVGNRAAELDATITGTVRVPQPGKTAAELEALAAKLRATPGDYELGPITMQVTEQIKYARNALKREHFDLNLEGGSPTFSRVAVENGALVLDYQVKVESLVKYKELEAQGLSIEDLVGKTVDARLPLAPEGLFARIGAKCATDPDSGAAVPEADVQEHNLFFYFDPARTGCPLGDADLTTVRYAVATSADAPTVFPEYDRLVADGKITMVAIFGQIEHGTLSDFDWGFRSFKTFSRAFESRGFRKVETFPGNRGHKLARTYEGGLTVEVTMYTPVDFADSVPKETSSAKFREAMRTNEVVYYNGHAFYGSLDVLNSRDAYPEGVYQVVFMDACWSYAYYTKQVFRNRATAADPNGWADVDVVNNTEPGITGSEETAAILYDNLFKGAQAVAQGKSARLYSWNKMIEYMNVSAEERAAERGGDHPDPEIYGVSGVRANAFQP